MEIKPLARLTWGSWLAFCSLNGFLTGEIGGFSREFNTDESGIENIARSALPIEPLLEIVAAWYFGI